MGARLPRKRGVGLATAQWREAGEGSVSWTDERVDKLKQLWTDGMSASQIAKELGGVTRNAVIGKVHRLGLSNRNAAEAEPEADSTPAAEPAAPETEEAAPLPEQPAADPPAPVILDASVPRAPGQPTPEEEAARVTLAEIEKMARRLDLMDLTERTCKWPIGDPTEEGFHFCGLPSVDGKPYCVYHIAIAFQPVSSRRDRSRSR